MRIIDIQQEHDVISRLIFRDVRDCLGVNPALVPGGEDIDIFYFFVNELAGWALTISDIDKTINNLPLVAWFAVPEVIACFASENEPSLFVGQRDSAHNKSR